MTLTWNPDKFKDELVEELKKNGEIVGKFVENDARRRLVAIEEPEKGKGYRRKYVARLVTHTVEREENEVVIKVGVAEGRSGTKHGFYIEMGSSKDPAKPFLRPAVFENAAKIVALLSGK